MSDPGADALLAQWMRTLAPYRGDRFLAACVLALTRALAVRIAFIAEKREPQAHALAFADRENTRQPFFYDHRRTPCRAVLAGEVVSVPCNVAELYPGEKGMEAYLGLPLSGSDGRVIGLVAVMDDQPFAAPERLRTRLEPLAPRIAAELECVLARRPPSGAAPA